MEADNSNRLTMSSSTPAGRFSRFFASNCTQKSSKSAHDVSCPSADDTPQDGTSLNNLSTATGSNKTVTVEEEMDGWEKPVGLTAEAAIEIDDDEESDVDDTNICDRETTTGSSTIAGLVSVSESVTESPPGDPRLDSTRVSVPSAEPSAEPSTEPSAEQSTEISSIAGDNLFAAFAFSSTTSNDTWSSSAATDFSIPARTTSVQDANTSSTGNKRPLAATGNTGRQKESKMKKKRRATNKNKCGDYIPVHQLPAEDQEKIRVKWQSLGDPNAPLEVTRFQVLVAARLHAQTKEPIVKAAMDNLRTHFSQVSKGEEGCLCAKTLSKADPKEIATIIPSVLFANTKSDHIIKAAKEVCSRFGGIVPHTRHGLMELTGIGPKTADILQSVNARKSYS